MHNKNLDNVVRKTRSYSSTDKPRLHASERDVPISPVVWNRFISEITEETIRYYPNTDKAYNKISEYLTIPISNITLYEGSDRGLRDVFMAYALPNTKVLTTNYHFPMYQIYADIYGCELILADEKNIAANITNEISLVVISNPSSPTGILFDKCSIRAIIDKCKTCNCMLLLDEAYIEFADTDETLVNEIHDSCIVLRTFSKAWGSAGVRIGYTVASTESTLLLKKVASMNCLSSLAVAWLNAILDNIDDTKHYIVSVKRNREKLEESLKKAGIDYIASQTNFMHIDHEFESVTSRRCIIHGKEYTRISIPCSLTTLDLILQEIL